MDNTIIMAFREAGPFGKTILITLFSLSIYIWTIIQSKYFLLKNIQNKNKIFYREYRKAGENIFQPIANEEKFTELPLFSLFSTAKEEVVRIMEQERGIDSLDVDIVANQLAKTVSQTKVELEDGITTLATTTAIAPFIGLLGTVWGIMNAFFGMGKMGNASIDAVAPGIAEALVNTAVGLLVAIPSAVAFNYAKNRIQAEITNMNNFSVELLSNIEKRFVSKGKK